MKYSNHFKVSEMACKCGCGTNQIDPHVIAILELVRCHFQQPVIITSARRCNKHNKAVGGAAKSQHLLGTAVDIKVKGIAPSTVYQFLDSTFPNSLGLGSYRTFTHIDIRPNKARW